MEKTNVIVIIGAPGTGKGTQCKLIANRTGMIHLSTGDMCREAVRLNTELGERIGEYFKRGDLIPDELINDVIQERLRQPDAIAQGVLLDGYPRTVKQARTLTRNSDIEIDRVILLQASDDICIERILGRRVDPLTGDTYNIKFPECSCPNQDIAQRLVRRNNDIDESTIKIRLDFYHMNLGHILKYFKGKIFPINGAKGIYEVNEDIGNALSQPIIPIMEDTTTEDRPIRRSQRTPRQLCAICLYKPADFLVIPCGHQCGCEPCLEQIFGQHNAKCPICRTSMTGFVQVFRSGIDDGNQEEAEVAVEQNEQYPFEGSEDDGGWGAADMATSHNMAISEFERNMSDNLKITVAPCDDIGDTEDKEVNVAINIQPPDIQESDRVPVDICCVIDTSISMSCDAKFQDPNDETQTITDGLTILDIVKHAVKTVIHTLTDQDRLSIVTFNTDATIVFTLSEMNEGGRKQAIDVLETLEPEGRTNIWAGLEAGLNALRMANEFFTGTMISRKKNIFLLTDGQPVISPPNGEDSALLEYLDTYPDLMCQIHTFGFGYTLKSNLLLDLATHGNGSFAFIPDAKIVGTCFINATANACSTLSQDCKVHLIPKNGAVFTGHVGGSIPFEETPWGIVVHLGPLQYGQSRDIVVPMNIPSIKMDGDNVEPPRKKARRKYNPNAYLEVVVEYENSASIEDSCKVISVGENRSSTANSIAAYVRNHAVKTAYEVISKCINGGGSEGVMLMKLLVGQVTAYEAVNNDPRLSGLLKDITGRMSKAITTHERFNRWGKKTLSKSHNTITPTPTLYKFYGSWFAMLWWFTIF